MNILFKVALMTAAAIIAALIGAVVFLAINTAPTLIWGKEIILVSAYLTIPIGGIAGIGVFGLTLLLAWRLIRVIPSADGYTSTSLRILFSATVLIGAAVIFMSEVKTRTIEIAWVESVGFFSDHSFELQRAQSFDQRGWRQQKPENHQIKTNKLTFYPREGDVAVNVESQLVPVYLGTIKGLWYLVLGPRPGGYAGLPVAAIEVDQWGNDFNAQAQRLSVLQGNTFNPIQWSECPEEIVASNLLTPAIVSLSEVQVLANGQVGPNEVLRLAKEYLRTHMDISAVTIGRSGNRPITSFIQVRAAFEKAIIPN